MNLAAASVTGRDAKKAQIHREHCKAGAGRSGNAGEEIHHPGGFVGIVDRDIEAGQTQRATHRERQGYNPTEIAQRMQRPEMNQHRGGDTEIHKVGKGIKLGTETA